MNFLRAEILRFLHGIILAEVRQGNAILLTNNTGCSCTKPVMINVFQDLVTRTCFKFETPVRLFTAYIIK
jgi:hypothetical protein